MLIRSRRKSKLLALRRLILNTARTTEGVGAIEEALNGDRASYLTSETRASTVRIDRVKSANQVAVYFHCQTVLVETFRELIRSLNYGGNRSISWMRRTRSPSRVRHCVALAADLSLNKRKKQL